MSQNNLTRFHPLQVTLHWLTVLLIVAAFIVGKSMSQLPNDTAKLTPLAIHMSIGVLTLVVIIVRFVVRMTMPQPAHAETGNVLLDWLGKAVHGILYLVVLLMTISGISLSMQSGLVPVVFGGSGAGLPADFQAFTARILHGFIAPALLVLVLLHVGAALYHQIIVKDNLLSRMWYGKQKR